MRSLVADLQQHIGSVVEAAAKLFAKAETALGGLDWSQSGIAAGTPTGFVLDPAARAQTRVLRGHAAALRTHAATFQEDLKGLRF